MVVVPTDETYKERVAAQEAAGNKDIPEEAIMEMKGRVNNMGLVSGNYYLFKINSASLATLTI